MEEIVMRYLSKALGSYSVWAVVLVFLKKWQE
jgi:hypothetical protein